MRVGSIVAMTIAAGCLLGGECYGQKEGAVSIRPLLVLNGGDSHVAKGALMCLSSQREWEKTWAEHLGTRVEDYYRTRMEVDFEQFMVVAIFLGDTQNVTGVEIHGVTESADLITIRMFGRAYQTVGESNNKPPDRPYAFIVLPRSHKQILLEEDIWAHRRDTPEWRVRARLPSASHRGLE